MASMMAAAATANNDFMSYPFGLSEAYRHLSVGDFAQPVPIRSKRSCTGIARLRAGSDARDGQQYVAEAELDFGEDACFWGCRSVSWPGSRRQSSSLAYSLEFLPDCSASAAVPSF